MTFQLHTLGWHSFQQLCLSILREVLGQTVESFLDVNDAGQDGAFCGAWSASGTELLEGRFVVQCKFTNRPGYSLRPSDISGEMAKVRRLVERGLCDVYVLMTNAGVSGGLKAHLVEQLALAGVSQSRMFGSTWIEQQIREHTRLRMMVPRVYGLGDLTQILDQRAYSQATAVLESMRDDLAKVVVTEAYRRAARALNEHRFVLLIGEPAAGKTTIASMLAMASADKWGALVVKADSHAALLSHWNPQESQLFWVDDAFGVTQYEGNLASGWNHVLPQMKSMLNRGSSIVMTSRDYIYKRARRDLKESAFPLFQESQTVVDVHDLTSDERTQILYNHLKLGKQTKQFRSDIKPHLPRVAKHPRFIPEIARRLSEPLFTAKLHLHEWFIDQFVDRRESFLQEVCEGLDVDCRAALALVYMRRSKLVSPIKLAPEESEALERLNSSLGACTSALEVLNGSLLVYHVIDGEGSWSFKHPTIGDAYSAILRSNPELLGIYVQGSDVEKLITQVTCGDVSVDGAVVLNRSLYSLMVERLCSFQASGAYKTEYLATWHADRVVKRFLATRCDAEFLATYLQAHPSSLDGLEKLGPHLEFSEDVDFAVRLFEDGLLPDASRGALVRAATQHAAEGNNARLLSDPRLRSLMNEDEQSRLRHVLRTEFLPQIERVRQRFEEEFADDGDLDASWHMRRYTQLLSAVEGEFPRSRRIKTLVGEQRSLISEWIEQRDSVKQQVPPRDLQPGGGEREFSGTRNIFDDIDE